MEFVPYRVENGLRIWVAVVGRRVLLWCVGGRGEARGCKSLSGLNFVLDK